MHNNIDYGKSPAPAFDAVEDVKNWFGPKYQNSADLMKAVKNPRLFSFWCAFAGIEGYPVKCWYEHFNGQGSWEKAWELVEPDEDEIISPSEQADLQDE